MAVVNEHPDTNVRKLYAGQVASHTGLPINDLVAIASRRSARPIVRVDDTRRVGSSENAEFVAIALLLQRWHDMAGWLDEVLFVDDVARRAFLAVAEGDGSVEPVARAGRSGGTRTDRAGGRRRHRRRPGDRGPQSDRRCRATRAGADASTRRIPPRSWRIATPASRWSGSTNHRQGTTPRSCC